MSTGEEVQAPARAGGLVGCRPAAGSGRWAGGISTHRLANGIRVAVEERPSAGLVGLSVWYLGGSGAESPEQHGYAHLVEHLMFQGSARVRPGEHLSAVRSAGGARIGASTSWDRIRFYQSVPASALDLTLWLEAERLRAGVEPVPR